jgi:hypothetical protein
MKTTLPPSAQTMRHWPAQKNGPTEKVGENSAMKTKIEISD